MDLSRVTWRKSRYSGNGADCVEIAAADAARAGTERLYLIRDSKNPDGAVLAFAPGEWDAFVGGIKSGKLDHLS
ncbi:DUF397 domain-containing protein [Thermopolyspora sp. NPDC052614]|uniref:DUF397 domain-containing protein n=1 Tax=Thermopolyspora sp. NPDC052614 TaxID=3155682 RepID=UPI00342FEA6B